MSSLMTRAQAGGASKPLSRAENAKLVAALLAGDTHARAKLIEGNMALVTISVERRVAQSPNVAYLRDDLISEGMSALVKAVDSFASKKRMKQSFTGYLSYVIQRDLSHYIDSEHTIQVPDRTQRFHRAKAKAGPESESARSLKPKFCPDSDVCSEPSTVDPVALLELQEEIEACCNDAVDLQIVRRAAMGYTEKEIGEAVGLPRLTIHRRKNAIYDRFLERTGMKRR